MGNVGWSVGYIKVVDRIHYLDKTTGKEKYRGYVAEGLGESFLKQYNNDSKK